MAKIRLETAAGGFVATGIMPAFQPMPEVVFWGIRVFRKATTGHDIETYRECFAYAIVETE